MLPKASVVLLLRHGGGALGWMAGTWHGRTRLVSVGENEPPAASVGYRIRIDKSVDVRLPCPPALQRTIPHPSNVVHPNLDMHFAHGTPSQKPYYHVCEKNIQWAIS